MSASVDRRRTLAALLVGGLIAVRAAGAVTLFDSSADPSVRLRALQPMPEAVRAILAFYAMRASTGCAYVVKDGPLQCALTTELGFASQCAPGELALVGRWFRDGVPPLNLAADEAKAARVGDLAAICYEVPDTATHRSQWSSIRLDRIGDQIQIHAVLAWTAGPDGPDGRLTMETRFLVLSDHLQVLKHTEKAER